MIENKYSPDFVIVGSAKCGTTSLATTLSEVEGIFITNPKEPEFYNIDQPSYEERQNYYALYEPSKPTDMIGEASTIYTRYPSKGSNTFANLYADNPKVKLIYVLREPIRRTYSEYCQLQSNQIRFGNATTQSYSEAIANHDYIINTSRYASQIARILEYFPREQLMLIDFDKLTKDGPGTFEAIFSFLELDLELPKELAYDNSTKQQFDDIEKGHLQQKTNSIPILRLLKRCLPSGIKSSLYSLLKSVGLIGRYTDKLTPSEFDIVTARSVYSNLEDDMRKLEQEYDFDISAWRKVWVENKWTEIN